MADFDLGEGVRKVLLAGIGALATGYEKGSAIVDDLVKKGELTVEQGKSLNTELKRKVGEALVNDANKDDAARNTAESAPAESAADAAQPSESADKD
ncbi:hypothetical protein JS530_00815 [Bifidobacterium sp. LC6]|uniref:Poly(Hydroxyalcanoate) granule associated protein (Phasin) n=1 Tax=Bifidobacterium colobi TaxID=2809026 RepID=A0ABS5UUD8_9BIFI|nr:hypothetical protein [Bifidobacterium colobi]MBT1174073.1 hypothetical protein [Bifidobacterium colobi]